ncbi:MAG: ACP S-malonyltransferase [Nevskia sp.]|nr:ACP S-malonyltransferase [Nevskia sp.]
MKYAVLFPGQGSQAVGMLAQLAAVEPVVDETFRAASTALGYDVLKLVREGPEDRLNLTQYTQPALLAAGIAVWRVWCARGLPPPAALAGHSLGEYSALVAAESIGFEAALKLVALRGELMQNAVPPGEGAMAAILGLSDAEVEKICAAYRDAVENPGVLEPANYNAPGQVVVAGHRAALNWLQAEAPRLGIRKLVPIAMSVPSHCSLMREAAARLAQALMEVEVKMPKLPVLHNLDARPRSSPDEIRDALIGQLHHSVRWAQTVRALSASGVQAFFECGPGRVLTNLNKRILEAGHFVALEEPDGMAKAAALLRDSV